MIKQFAGTITSFLIHENIISKDEREIYQYGSEQLIINLTTLITIALIAMLMKGWTETIFFLVGMLPIRAIAGGFHASTPVRCNVLTISVYMLNILIIKIVRRHMTMLPLLILLIFIFFSIYKYAPVDHINKVLEVDELLISKKKSRIIATMIFGTCIGLSMVIGPKHIIVVGTMMGALTASISLIIGSVKRGGEEDENN